MKAKLLFHKIVYHVALFFARFSLVKYNFHHSKRIHLNEPTLILCNHTTESDMVMVASCFYEHMYIVCGEHLLRSGAGRSIMRFFDPVSASKGASHLPTIREMTKRFKAGHNIMLFPEGSRSFNGITEPMGNSLGKLIKLTGCALATVRSSGGYFVAPRWAYNFRKGPVSAEVQHVISAAKLKEMTAEEIVTLINEDIHEDAYETQRIRHHRYRCKGGLAEGIENFLIICPDCGAYDSFTSSGNNFSCTCGLSASIDEEGFIKRTDGEPSAASLPFDSVSDWGKWIEERFDSDMEKRDASALLFTEEDIRLYRIDDVAHSSQDIALGKLKVYSDRMEFYANEEALEPLVFRYEDISEAAMLYYGKSLLFTHKSGYFGMTGENFHAWKESRLHRIFSLKHYPDRKRNAI